MVSSQSKAGDKASGMIPLDASLPQETSQAVNDLSAFSFSAALGKIIRRNHLVAGLVISEMIALGAHTPSTSPPGLPANPAAASSDTFGDFSDSHRTHFRRRRGRSRNQSTNNVRTQTTPVRTSSDSDNFQAISNTANSFVSDQQTNSQPSSHTFSSENFRVTAPDRMLAQQLAKALDQAFEELSVTWLGRKTSPLRKDCLVTVTEVGGGAGATTNFIFDRGQVFDFKMDVRGTVEKLNYDIARHEVTHMLMAEYFKEPIPRWADEGAATIAESFIERRKMQIQLKIVMADKRDVSLENLFAVDEYPADLMPLYSQGHSLTAFLVAQGGAGTEGRRKFLRLIEDLCDKQVADYEAVAKHYGYPTISDLETAWRSWVGAGEPGWELDPKTCLTEVAPFCWPKQTPAFQGDVTYVGL